MRPAVRETEAAKFRAAYHLSDPVDPQDGPRWLRREIIVQRAVLLCDLDEEGTPVIGGRWHRYHTDAEYHAWVTTEARIAAELALAKALGQPVADQDAVAFLRARGEILNTSEKRARFETDEEYELAVFVMTMAALQDARDGSITRQASELFATLPLHVSIDGEPPRAD